MTEARRDLPMMPVPASRECGCADDCCGGTPTERVEVARTLPESANADEVRAVVRESYGRIATTGSCGCGCTTGACCGGADATAVLGMIGYGDTDVAAVPEGSNLGLGCGNPLAYANAQPGEVVLDLGSGAGIDCFLAARAVGATGRVIGVDMTPAMLERARANAATHRFANVEFRLGEIEHLPVPDASVDLVISNCVVNLSPEKLQVFREAYRALKPGGRMLVSDLVLDHAIPPELQRSTALLVGCVAGAAVREDYLRQIREAGFTGVEIVAESGYDVGTEDLAADAPERAAFDAVRSLKVRALKR